MPTARDIFPAGLLLMAGLAAAPAGRAEPAAVAIYVEPAALPGDAVRDGADEFSLLLRVAALRQGHAAAGLVCVGSRFAGLRPRSEAALDRVALMGLPVVRLRRGAASGSSLRVEAGPLPPAAAAQLLQECLGRFGPPPAAADPGRPTAAELAAVRARLALYQRRFDAALGATSVALR